MRTPKGKSAWEDAYDTILQQILTLQIQPGEVVTELSLAERTGLGRTPVREALKRLEQEGLIVTTNRTKHVYILTIKEVKEIFELKRCIEASATRWAIAKGKESDFQRLRNILSELKAIAAKRPTDDEHEEDWLAEWLEKDKQLHDQIFEMADNKQASQLITILNTKWHRLKLGILTMEGRTEKSIIEHEKFVHAILNRDADSAEIAIKEHLNNLERMLIKMMKLFHYPTALSTTSSKNR